MNSLNRDQWTEVDERFDEFHKQHCDFMGGISSNVVKYYTDFWHSELEKVRQETIKKVENYLIGGLEDSFEKISIKEILDYLEIIK